MTVSSQPRATELTLNIVYEGAPQAGKTASLLALGRLLQQPVVTPGESNGRTLYFDWLSYRGGNRLGQPIRSRAIAVPGQRELGARRKAILSHADALVFVADSSAPGFPASIEHFEQFGRDLEALQPEIPKILQINKRDCPDALTRDAVLDRLRGQFQHVVESVAIEGEGIREAFAMAVSEAVKSLAETNRLYGRGRSGGTGDSEITPRQLLQILLDLEPEIDESAEGELTEPPLTERSPDDRFTWGTQPIAPISVVDDGSA